MVEYFDTMWGLFVVRPLLAQLSKNHRSIKASQRTWWHSKITMSFLDLYSTQLKVTQIGISSKRNYFCVKRIVLYSKMFRNYWLNVYGRNWYFSTNSNTSWHILQCACTLFCKHEIFLRTGNKFGACGDNWAAAQWPGGQRSNDRKPPIRKVALGVTNGHNLT